MIFKAGHRGIVLNRKHWLTFGVIQAIGIMGVISAVFLQFPSMVIVSFLMLLPGSLVSAALFKRAQTGADWSPWSLTAIAVLANVLLFTIISVLLAGYRKSKRISPET
jgi:uncharacterized membrane protein